MSVKTKMTAIADKIRGLLGLTGTMGLDTMADNLSTAQGEVDTQAGLIAQISSVLSGKAGSGSSGGGGSANPVLQIKTVTPTKSSQVVKPDSGYDGLSQVNVNAIPSDYIIPSGSKTITANGTFDVTNYASAVVNVHNEEPNIQSLSITENGTYTAPSGVDGYSPITVNVPTSGGGSVETCTVSLDLYRQSGSSFDIAYYGAETAQYINSSGNTHSGSLIVRKNSLLTIGFNESENYITCNGGVSLLGVGDMMVFTVSGDGTIYI